MFHEMLLLDLDGRSDIYMFSVGWLESVQNYTERSRIILLCSDAVHDLYMMCARARVRVLQIRLNRRGLTLMVPDRKRILNIRFLMLSEGEYKH